MIKLVSEKLSFLIKKFLNRKPDQEEIQEHELQDKTVYLIAAGYEWTCPHCERMNREIEIVERVRCGACGKAYEVNEAEHAWG